MVVGECSRKSETSSKLDRARKKLIAKHGVVGADQILTQFALALHEDEHFVHKQQWSKCQNCNLSKTCTQVVYGSGPHNAPLLVIGEAPGPQEDQLGVPFSGPTGTFLRKVMDRVGIPSSDVYFTNSVACVPRDTINSHFRQPKSEEIESCLPRLNYICDSVIKDRKLTLLVGKPGYVAYTNRHSPQEIEYQMGRVRVKDIIGWHRDTEIPSYVIYHPSYIMRRKDRSLTQEWINQIKEVHDYITEVE